MRPVGFFIRRPPVLQVPGSPAHRLLRTPFFISRLTAWARRLSALLTSDFLDKTAPQRQMRLARAGCDFVAAYRF